MSVLLDACAIVSFLCDEVGAEEVEELLETRPATTALNIAEVVDTMTRVHGQDADSIEAELVMLGIEIEPVPPDMAIAAGRVRSECYHRKRCPVSLADCVAAVAALSSGHSLATSDAALANVGDELGVTIRPLLSSSGMRPEVAGLP